MASPVPPSILPVLRACALAAGLVAATGAAAEDAGRRGGWADEVKRSLDRPSPRPEETTGSGRTEREPSRPKPGAPPAAMPTPLMSAPPPR